jgi:hypothetical protein
MLRPFFALGHNEVADSKVGPGFADLVGGPTVLTGEEIIALPKGVRLMSAHQPLMGKEAEFLRNKP